MDKITIIGLGLTGNSIGLGLKQAAGEAVRVTGFDPDHSREQYALRKYKSVDEISPDLERAVRGAALVVVCTPVTAALEVFEAIAPFLDANATVTDTMPLKEPVLKLASESLGPGKSFVGGHPFSLTVDLDVAGDDVAPAADLFAGAPWCIMPAPGAGNSSLNTVINLAEMLGAKPLFIDPVEHDSFLAAVSHLPVAISIAFLKAVAGSPAWTDMSALAHGRFREVSHGVGYDPQTLADTLSQNRGPLLRWIDGYMEALYDVRSLLATGDVEALVEALTETSKSRRAWADPGEADAEDARLRAELRQAISESRPSQALMGTYLTEKLFRRKERGQ
jgi:prephenate dehydrogenase